MTLQARASTTVSASAQEVLEFVLDLEKYMAADHKITKVVKVTGPDESGAGSAKLWGRMKGTPPSPDVQNFQLDRWSKITFTGAPKQPGRLVFDFVGTFECDEGDEGTVVTHAYTFDFKGPFRIMEKVLGNWLQEEIDEEMARLGDLLTEPADGAAVG